MAVLKTFTVENYRSIRGPLHLTFVPGRPLILLGENNSGKSNIVKALDLLLGSTWPGTHSAEDHEFFQRSRDNRISIKASFSPTALYGRHSEVEWSWDDSTGDSEDRPLYRGDGGYKGYVNSGDRDSCICVVAHAEHNLHYQLGYSSKYTLLSRLMHRFHEALLRDPATRDSLRELFEQIRQRFHDITEFAQFSEKLREQLGEFVGSMTHRLEVDFQAYNPTNFFHALRLQATEDGDPRTLAEMGTGEQQVLALSFAYAFARAFHGGLMLAIEEPEAHLHPLAQQWLAEKLTAMAAGGLQLLLTTHSPHFVDMLNLEGLVLIRKEGDRTTAKQLTSTDLVAYCTRTGVQPARVTTENILPFYKAHAAPRILEGFFAKVVVLVEGTTESLALPVYLKRSGLAPLARGVCVVPVGGKGNLGKWWRLFTAYGIPCFTVFDNDNSGEDADGSRRRDALVALGVPSDSVDDYLGVTDWRVGEAFCIFGTDFETTLRETFAEYAELEARARDSGIHSKPFVARWVADRLDLPEDHSGTEKLREFAGAIAACLPPEPARAPAPGGSAA